MPLEAAISLAAFTVRDCGVLLVIVTVAMLPTPSRPHV